MFAKPRQRYAFALHIRCAERHRYVPYSFEVDFDAILRAKGIQGKLDTNAILVRKVLDGQESPVHFNLSDEWAYGNRGKINLLLTDTAEQEYLVYFDTEDNGPYEAPAYRGLVGNGDCLAYNDGRPHPLHVGMHANPFAVDWDGDGKTDLLSPQMYSYTYGSPWFCVKFYRNIGTNQAPLFAEGVPLRCWQDGDLEVMEDVYWMTLADWNADGLPDLITAPPGSKRELHFYRNTGDRDPRGLPILVREFIQPYDPSWGNVFGLRVVDWYGDGRLSLLVGLIQPMRYAREDPLWFAATEAEKDSASWPRGDYVSRFKVWENLTPPQERPRFAGSFDLVDAAGQLISYHAISSIELYPRDDVFDLLVLDDNPLMAKGHAGIRYYKNIGTKGHPQFEDLGRIDGIQDRCALYFNRADSPAFQGLLVCHGESSGKIRYYTMTWEAGADKPRLVDRGFLQQQNAYLSTYAGYAEAWPCDPDADGDTDLITGCETGYIQLFRNIGTREWPVFAEPVFLEQGGKPICVLNGPFDDPYAISEACLGQACPMYVDWDGDGVPDLVLAVGRKLYYYRNVGTASEPVFSQPVEITDETGRRIVPHRSKPIIMDFDGDGLCDVISHPEYGGAPGGYPGYGTLKLFRRYRDPASGELKLRGGIELRYADGSPITTTREGDHFNAGDWFGKGSYDILLTCRDKSGPEAKYSVAITRDIAYLKNIGSNEEPLFAKPEILRVEGQKLGVGYHVTTPIPYDWDGTGKLDLLVSGESGLIYLFRRHYIEGTWRKITHQLIL